MLGQNSRVIHERGIQIPIPKNSSTQSRNKLLEVIDYDLNKNNFDPTKSSPPNDFLLKLQKRMKMYEIVQDFSQTS
jgi:hypothetical protein